MNTAKAKPIPTPDKENHNTLASMPPRPPTAPSHDQHRIRARFTSHKSMTSGLLPHQSATISILRQHHKPFLLQIFLKLEALPSQQHPLLQISKVEQLITEQMDLRMSGYKWKLLEVVDQIVKLRQNIVDIEELYANSIRSISAQDSPASHHSLTLKNQLSRILSSIDHSEFAEEFSPSQEWVPSHKGPPSFISAFDEPEWKQIFKAYKWVYKFCLELFASGLGARHQVMQQSMNAVYKSFKFLKIGVSNSKPYECVLEAMKECNSQMEGLRDGWVSHSRKGRAKELP